jgi:hypothetical protein
VARGVSAGPAYHRAVDRVVDQPIRRRHCDREKVLESGAERRAGMAIGEGVE